MLNPIATRSFSGATIIRSPNGIDRELRVINPSISQDRVKENNNQIRQAKSLTSDEVTRRNSEARTARDLPGNTSRSNNSNTNQRFTLSAEQSTRLAILRNDGAETENSTNSSVNQYLETQSLQRRAEIESLAGVDLFV